MLLLCCAAALALSMQSFARKQPRSQRACLQWEMADLIARDSLLRIAGHPLILEGSHGKAVAFNGSTDGLFLSEMPLAHLESFTIEAILAPASRGNFEQRFFHTGEIRGDRALLELRSTGAHWYLDAFLQSGNQKMTLIDPQRLHPSDQWYHVAFVVDRGELSTYVDGKRELAGQITFVPFQSGKTSIGVRLNEQSWFKGVIAQIRITPKALKASDFLKVSIKKLPLLENN